MKRTKPRPTSNEIIQNVYGFYFIFLLHNVNLQKYIVQYYRGVFQCNMRTFQINVYYVCLYML